MTRWCQISSLTTFVHQYWPRHPPVQGSLKEQPSAQRSSSIWGLHHFASLQLDWKVFFQRDADLFKHLRLQHLCRWAGGFQRLEKAGKAGKQQKFRQQMSAELRDLMAELFPLQWAANCLWHFPSPGRALTLCTFSFIADSTRLFHTSILGNECTACCLDTITAWKQDDFMGDGLRHWLQHTNGSPKASIIGQ